MDKTSALAKMNNRHGTNFADYFSMLTWLRRSAERCERKGVMYAEQAAEYRADYSELLRSE